VCDSLARKENRQSELLNAIRNILQRKRIKQCLHPAGKYFSQIETFIDTVVDCDIFFRSVCADFFCAAS
jgi:hypothetical protein